jgi:hypothetical protein
MKKLNLKLICSERRCIFISPVGDILGLLNINRYLSLPLRREWDIRFCGMLYSVELHYRRFGKTYRYCIKESSRPRRIALILKMRLGPIGGPETSVSTNLRCVRFQNRDDLVKVQFVEVVGWTGILVILGREVKLAENTKKRSCWCLPYFTVLCKLYNLNAWWRCPLRL